MKNLIAGVALAAAACPSAACAAVNMRFECAAAAKPAQPPELPGLWDMVMDVNGVPSFGLLSVGRSGTELMGSVALNAGVAVVRSLKSVGEKVEMVVVTGEGDVRFDGTLAADGKRMCGIVSYHNGQKLEMVAQRRPDRARPRSQ